MLSVSGKNWEETKVSSRILDKLKNDNNFSELVSKIIISNNFDELEINTLKEKISLHNPFYKTNDFKNAANILKKSLDNDDKILILGDYDVDGCVSTSLLVNFLNNLNYKFFSYYIPNRFKDGYGASLNLIKNLEKQKPDLIILVDCGSTSHDAINYLQSTSLLMFSIRQKPVICISNLIMFCLALDLSTLPQLSTIAYTKVVQDLTS